MHDFFFKNKQFGRTFIRNQFLKFGAPERSLDRWITSLEQEKTLERKIGSGNQKKIATKQSIARLKKAFDHKQGMSQRKMAAKLNCSQTYVWMILKKFTTIRCYKKHKKPQMTELQKKQARPKCRKLLEKYAKCDFILDDKTYFTLSNTTLPGNNRFYSSNVSEKLDSIKNKYIAKFEPKVLLYIAISPLGTSRPLFFKSGLAINQIIYKEICLKKALIPLIKDKYRHRRYVFWPDLASSHYARSVQNYLTSQKVLFVPKMINPACVPKARPIEDFFGCLKDDVVI